MIFSRIQSIARHVAIYGLGDLLGRAVAVLSVSVYAGRLSPADSGAVPLPVAVIGFTVAFYVLGLPVYFAVRAFRTVLAPAPGAPNAEATRQLGARVITYFALIGTFMCLLLATFGHDVIARAAGAGIPAYLSDGDIAPVAALAFFCYGLYIVLTAGVYAEVGSLPAIVGVGTAVNAVLTLVLLPRIGFVAVTWVAWVAYGVQIALLISNGHRVYPVACEYVRLGKIVATGAVVFLALSRYLHDTTGEGIVARGIFLTGYPLILWGWHFFEPGELRRLRAIIANPGSFSEKNRIR